jgi:hypothetical protein
MLYEVLNNKETRSLLYTHCRDILALLLKQNISFDVLADVKAISFNPQLPLHLRKNFAEFTLFALANYTLQSAYIEKGKLIFEAGFGKENFGSVVSIPIGSILQILIDNTPIFINLSATFGGETFSSSVENSMQALLSNPENKKLLKKKNTKK